MRTEYKLYRKPVGASLYKADVRPYPTPVDAAAATDLPDLDQWTARADQDGWYADSFKYLITAEPVAENDTERVQLALNVALSYGQDDATHHKAWVIDQMVRVLTADRYERVIADYRNGEDGPDTYEWDEGIAP